MAETMSIGQIEQVLEESTLTFQTVSLIGVQKNGELISSESSLNQEQLQTGSVLETVSMIAAPITAIATGLGMIMMTGGMGGMAALDKLNIGKGVPGALNNTLVRALPMAGKLVYGGMSMLSGVLTGLQGALKSKVDMLGGEVDTINQSSNLLSKEAQSGEKEGAELAQTTSEVIEGLGSATTMRG